MAQTDGNRSDLDLMAHFDGELEAAEASELSAAISDDAPSRAKLEALGQISEVVRTAIELEVDQVMERSSDPFASMWSNIEKEIARPGEPARAVVPPPKNANEALGLFARIAQWFEEYRSQIATGAMAAVAAAALVWFVRPAEKSIEYVEVEREGAGAGTAEVMPVSLESQSPEIESLEVYDGSGVVLTVQGDEGEADSVVIWLSSPEDTVEGPI